jgi:DNA-binding transcriptional LysR family regulator
MEAEAVRMTEELAGPDHGASGAVRISTLEGFGNFFLASRIGAFANLHPRLTVELIAIQQITALSRREADLAITLSPPPAGRFVSEPLTDYQLFVYGAPGYLDSQPPIRGRDDLVAHAFVGYIDDLIFTRGLDYLSEFHPDLRARLQNSSLHAQMEAAASGFGLCVLPSFIAAANPRLVRILPEELSLIRSYWMTSPEDVAESQPVRLARRFIKDQVNSAVKEFMPLA